MKEIMEQFFLQLAARSLAAVPFIGAIFIIRFVLKRFPRGYVYALWMLLLTELILPFQLASPIGFLPQVRIAEWNTQEEIDSAPDHQSPVHSDASLESTGLTIDWGDVPQAFSGEVLLTDGPYSQAESSVVPIQDEGNAEGAGTHAFKPSGTMLQMSRSGISIAAVIWLAGFTFLFARHLLSLHRLRKRVAFAVKGEAVCLRCGNRPVIMDRIWETEGIDSPFILPGFRAKVYLPFGLDRQEKEDILSHEYYHIHYLHPWIKWIAGLVVMVYWFNPFIWMAVKLFAQDMEIICDDAALRNRSADDRREYAQTLLKYSMKTSGLKPCLAFGESGVENRIRYMMNGKRPGRVIGALLLIMIPLCFMGFMPAGRSSQAAVSTGDASDPVQSTKDGVMENAEVNSSEEEGSLDSTSADNMDVYDVYKEPVLHCYIPDFYLDYGYTDTALMPEDKYEGLARQALRELYILTGTQVMECCYYYTDMGGFVFGLTEDDLEHGREFYSRYYDESVNNRFLGIASIYIAYADDVWYSPVHQMVRPKEYESMTYGENAVWLLKQSGVYNGREVVSCYQPYDTLDDTWRMVMDDGTVYEISLDLARKTATNISGPYPDENINH